MIDIPSFSVEQETGRIHAFSGFLSPDGGQLLFIDKDYVAIVNLLAMKVDRAFGCVVSTICPTEINKDTPNYSDYLNSLIINSVYWVPAH